MMDGTPMKIEDRVRYNLVYAEQLQRYLVNLGLSNKEADYFIFECCKKNEARINGMKRNFTGTDKQWELLKSAAPHVYHSSHAISIFLSQ